MKHLKEIKLLDASALSKDPLAEGRVAATVPKDHAFRLHTAVLAESPSQNSFCIFKETLADHRLFPRVDSMQLSKVSKNEL